MLVLALLAAILMHYVLEDVQNLQQCAGLVHQQMVVCVQEAEKAALVIVHHRLPCIVVS
jgi:hypothetical protein|tara:strand:+ start:219 stop:395 length:177 start_codon:yes stop_codon:yes gene_type:complete